MGIYSIFLTKKKAEKLLYDIHCYFENDENFKLIFTNFNYLPDYDNFEKTISEIVINLKEIETNSDFTKSDFGKFIKKKYRLGFSSSLYGVYGRPDSYNPQKGLQIRKNNTLYNEL